MICRNTLIISTISLLSPARLSEISGFGLEKAILPENGKNRFFMNI